jgi:hypothetical protein
MKNQTVSVVGFGALQFQRYKRGPSPSSYIHLAGHVIAEVEGGVLVRVFSAFGESPQDGNPHYAIYVPWLAFGGVWDDTPSPRWHGSWCLFADTTEMNEFLKRNPRLEYDPRVQARRNAVYGGE